MAEAKKITTVTMLDGRIVDFPGKRKLQKTSTIGEDGTVVVCQARLHQRRNPHLHHPAGTPAQVRGPRRRAEAG